MTVRRPLSVLVVGLLLGLVLVVVATPASAACHIASFDASSAAGEEGTTVELLVFLIGRQSSCEGTLDYRTVGGTAVEGADYVSTSGTLSFVAGDDREETIAIQLLADDEVEGDETFTVELSAPTGGITGTGDPAMVTITDPGGASGVDGGTGDDVADAGTAADTSDVDDGGPPTGMIVAVVALAVVGLGAFVFGRSRGTT